MSDPKDRIGAKYEWMGRDELTAFQSQALRQSVTQAAKSPYYSRIFTQADIDVDSIVGIEDVTRLPFTTKDDLRFSYPNTMLTVEPEQVVRMHTSSGTTGKPTAIFHTQEDVDNWAELMARSLAMGGATPKDVFQNMSGYGLFTGGLGLHYGAERLGMWVIPAGAGNTARQILLIRDFHVTVIHATPSYAMHVAERMLQEGEDPKSLNIKMAALGAEPYTEELRLKLQDLYGFKAFNSYGLSEMNGPGVAFECPYQNGLHVWEDSYLVEIINPETLQPVADGEVGELVLTTLRRTAMPIIRYRTRDLTRKITADCPCGRKHVRLSRFVGRSDDMLIIRGVNVFPSQVEEVIMRHEWLGGNYVITLTTKEALDQMTVKVEIAKSGFDGSMLTLRRLRDELQRELKEQIGFTAEIDVLEPGSLPASEGKAKRVIDERD
ncbi:MAG: phenylacetate--CoA ligase [Armatimonadetes bacterium]|nr:phenylacetate--CoA ligase [Armatimonadota bacterium]